MDIFGTRKKRVLIETISSLESNQKVLQENLNEVSKVNAMMINYAGGRTLYFDGEKTPNELGTPYDFALNYQSLRMRAWESYIKSSLVQTAIKQYCLWIVGSGLKFQSEPNTEILKSFGINLEDSWSTKIEASFRLYASDKRSSYSKEMNIHQLASEALKNAILAGDVLVILRYEGYQPTVDIIDGLFVQTPYDYLETSGVKIVDGVELSKTGAHIAYHVFQNDGTFKRILANPSGQTGARQAWLMYGLRHKISDTRGMSLLTAIMERDAKLDRFVEASVGSAEENSKVPYTIVHNQYSDGENPLLNQMTEGIGVPAQNRNETQTSANAIATKIAVTTQKQTYNMPIGAEFKSNITHTDPNFENFYTPNAELIFATIGIPSEVALSKYGGSYSGSRAAIKGWEYKIKVEREITLTQNFYKPTFEFFFLINMYKGNIQADGYRDALREQNWMLTSAYTSCRFIGQSVPHIDPVKEANAERILLGKSYDMIPLKTGEQSCENQNSGDFNEIQKVAKKEVESSSFKEVVEKSVGNVEKTAGNAGKTIKKNANNTDSKNADNTALQTEILAKLQEIIDFNEK